MPSNKKKVNMLQRKVTTSTSELNNFFAWSEKVCEAVLWVIRSLKLNSKRFQLAVNNRTTYSPSEVLMVLLIFPLLQLSNVMAYSQSILVKLFRGGKDVFYCLKNNDRIWSHVSNSSMLGFKELFLGYHDGKSFMDLIFRFIVFL